MIFGCAHSTAWQVFVGVDQVLHAPRSCTANALRMHQQTYVAQQKEIKGRASTSNQSISACAQLALR